MTERRSKRKKRESDTDDEDSEPSDEQTEIAKHLRFNCETKSSSYQSQKVAYFKGSKGIDCLLDSKWASGKGGTEILFTDRKSVQDYLQVLLELGMFKRVTRVRKKKKSEKDEGKKETKENKDSPKPAKLKKEKELKVGDADGKKMKVKVKLELHEYQEFLDGEEVYMWVFDPMHPRTIIYGVLVVIGAIVICLFPLWPPQMREYTWYLSVGAAILLGALLVVALFRYVLFAFVWLITIGNHHFWLLPNLTEDCGFFESFVPLYTHTNVSKKDEEKNKGKSGDKEADKEDDKNQLEHGKVEETNNEEKKDKEEKGNTGTFEEGNGRKSSLTNAKETSESEPWINVTDEDIAHAKEAIEGDASSSETLTSTVNC